MWIHPYIRMYPHSLRKQLFSLADSYLCYMSIKYIERSTRDLTAHRVHGQHHSAINRSITTTKANTVDMIFYRINCIGHSGWIIFGEFYCQTPQNMIYVWKTLSFSLRNWNGQHWAWKTLTLARFNWSLQRIFGPGRIDCTIKMVMRYSNILFVHTSVDTSSYMAGFHLFPLYLCPIFFKDGLYPSDTVISSMQTG